MNNFKTGFALLGLSFFCSCSTSKHSRSIRPAPHLTFLSEYVVPFNKSFESTTIGGLSGIDYDRGKNQYYLISDDRSDKNPGRFYTAQMTIRKNRIDTVIFTGVTFLKDQMGNFYPSSRQDPSHCPDPEALRHFPGRPSLIWSSEGERKVTPPKTVLENPAVTEIDPDGSFRDTFELPSQFHMAMQSGPRQNGVFEGLTFDAEGNNLWVSTEEPLLSDGPRAGTGDSSAIIRIIQFNTITKKQVAQYAYRIEPVAYPPLTPSAFKVNGIADILWLGDNQLLVVERSYSTGRLACTIKVFIANMTGASNIDQITSLKNNPGIQLMSKKLLLNMDDLGRYIDNIEGVTFGPTLPNGKRSLIFVADNNFTPLEKTQFLLFELN